MPFSRPRGGGPRRSLGSLGPLGSRGSRGSRGALGSFGSRLGKVGKGLSNVPPGGGRAPASSLLAGHLGLVFFSLWFTHVFSTETAAVVFHQEDSHADPRIQGLKVVHIPDLVGLVGALSVAETEEQHMTVDRRSWTGNCMPYRRSLGRDVGSPGYSCLRH